MLTALILALAITSDPPDATVTQPPAALTPQQECLLDRLDEWISSKTTAATIQSLIRVATVAAQECNTDPEAFFDPELTGPLCRRHPDTQAEPCRAAHP